MEQPAEKQMHLLPWEPEWSETPWERAWLERLEMLEFDLLQDRPGMVAEHCALDAMLLYRVASGARPPVVWFQQWSEPAIILGSYQSVSNEIDLESAERNGFSFARRMSGGGAMVVEPRRTITYSIIVPVSVVKGMSLVQSFALLDAWCVRALRSLGIPARYRPINDIASPTGKIAGAAQCRRRGAVLHHVTMAYELSDDLVFSLLRLGRPRLTAKGIPSAVKHVSPLSAYTDLSFDVLRERLVDAFRAQFKTRESGFDSEETEEAERLLRDKFTSREWLYRVE